MRDGDEIGGEMSITKPLFLEGINPDADYFVEPNPYTYTPSSNVNLLELSRYARKTGKQLVELTAEEVDRFRS